MIGWLRVNSSWYEVALGTARGGKAEGERDEEGEHADHGVDGGDAAGAAQVVGVDGWLRYFTP